MVKTVMSLFLSVVILIVFLACPLSTADEPYLEEEYTITTAVSPADSGSILFNPDAGSYQEGTVVGLTANPTDNFTFQQWTGDLSGSTNPTSLTMDTAKSVVAEFVVACTVGSYEPNETINSCYYLGTFNEDDPEDSITARIVPQGDMDFYRFYAKEGSHICSPGTDQDYIVEIRLQPPTGKDYDLYLYDDGSNLLDLSILGGSSEEIINYDWDGECGTDDSRYFRIEVRPHLGAWDCDNYTLYIDMWDY